MRIRQALLLPFLLPTLAMAQAFPDGPPTYDPAVDNALFIWKESDGTWRVRGTAGSAGNARYVGSVSADQPFTQVTPFDLEGADVLNTDDPTKAVFDIEMWSPWRDGFDFKLPTGASACVELTTATGSVLVGAERVLVTPPFDLLTLGDCVQSPPRLSVAGATVSEGAGNVTVTVNLAPASTQNVSVDISTADGTATAPADYTPLGATTVTFAPGETQKSVAIAVTDDAASESTESFQVNLANPVNAEIASAAASVTIVDDDAIACGEPAIDGAADAGVFVWQDCASGRWNLRATAGADGSRLFVGSVVSDQPLSSVQPVSIEGGDVFDTSSADRINFSLQMWSPWHDGFTFLAAADASTCLTVDGQLFLGRNRIAKSAPLDLATLQPCAGSGGGDKPNIVVFLTDDQRWDTLWAMPILQEKLLSRGVEFTNAFITTPICCPSRASIIAGGFYAHNTGVLQVTGDNGGADQFRGQDGDTLATNLQAAGYKTLFAGGKYLNGYQPPYIPPGWTKFVNNNLGPYSANWFDFKVTIGSSGPTSSVGQIVDIKQYVTNYHRDVVLDFLSQTGGSPFFVFFSVFAPHYPATPDTPDTGLFADFLYRDRAYGEADLSDKPDWVANPNRYLSAKTGSDEFPRKQLRSLQAVDRAIGAIVDKVAAQGKLDNTVFIFTSDNGYLWGEHGLYEKGMAYEESIRVPFIVVAPGVAARVEPHLVSPNLDIGPTLYQLAGVNKVTDGRSLIPLLQDPNAPWRAELLCEHWGSHEGANGTWSALRTGQYKYIENSRHEKELYDLLADPFEEESQHAAAGYAQLMADMAADLEAQRGFAPITFTVPAGTVGQSYSVQLRGWGGATPYRWEVHSGQLPQGLSLNAATGVISGTPTQAGTQSVKIKVHDSSVAAHTGQPQQYIAPGEPFTTYDFVINP